MAGGRHRGTSSQAFSRPESTKVPEVNACFWAAKILSTAMGEATADYLVHRFNPYLAVAMGFVTFAIAIIVQFSVRRYVTWVYWITVAMVAIFGTMVADALHVGAHVPYKVSATLFIVAVAVILVVWYTCEHTLSIHSIYTPRREFFYWATVIATFALGTSVGDLTASTFHLGYLSSTLLYTGLIVIPSAAYRLLGLNGVAAFWTAYILTRPIGASFADWLAFPHGVGGENVGHGPIALTTAVAFLLIVAYLAVSRKDVMIQPQVYPGRVSPPIGASTSPER